MGIDPDARFRWSRYPNVWEHSTDHDLCGSFFVLYSGPDLAVSPFYYKIYLRVSHFQAVNVNTGYRLGQSGPIQDDAPPGRVEGDAKRCL